MRNKMSENIQDIKSHREWRKQAKKERRKKIRRKLAILRNEKEEENMKDPTYLKRLAEINALELLKSQEEERHNADCHEKWMRAELIAQTEFRKIQRKLEEIEKEKLKERLKIKEEFQLELDRVAKLKNERKILAEEKKRVYDQLMFRINSYIMDGGDIPAELTVNADTNPGKPFCSFFVKTGSCRFGDRCLRNHSRPGISRLLLIPNFFTHIQLEQNTRSEYNVDSFLEYDDTELQLCFIDFFHDVTTELEIFGTIKYFFVCCNYEPHLRGNVYIEYENQRDSLKAFQKLQGRFYGGKQLNVEFCSVISWMTAICGLSLSKQCPKGKSCNFLHIFKNPNKKYPLIERKNNSRSQTDPYIRRKIDDLWKQTESVRNRSWNDENDCSKRNWRWSESPENDRNSLHKQNEERFRESYETEKSRERRTSSLKIHIEPSTRLRTDSSHQNLTQSSSRIRLQDSHQNKHASTSRIKPQRSHKQKLESSSRIRSKSKHEKNRRRSSERRSKSKEKISHQMNRKIDEKILEEIIVKKHKRNHKKHRK